MEAPILGEYGKDGQRFRRFEERFLKKFGEAETFDGLSEAIKKIRGNTQGKKRENEKI